MTHVAQHGSFRVAVHDAVAVADATPDEVLALCAAAARNGSHDAVDLALVRAAIDVAGPIPYQQGAWSGPGSTRRYAIAQLRNARDGRTLRVARGALDGVLALAGADAERRAACAAALQPLAASGYVGVGVAVDDGAGAWRYAGTVPVRVTATRTAARDAPFEFRYVHVWDWQLRLLHWTWVLLITTLAATGLCIAEGWFLDTGVLTNGFAFGWIRLVHLAAGWLLFAVLIVRVGRLCFGSNRYQRWRALLPLSRGSLRDALVTAKDYALMQSWRAPRYIGHNPLQQWTYTGVYVLLVAMMVTGFAIYALYEPRHWFFGWFMWLNDWLGNATVRLLHTAGMWLLLLFVPAHVYLSVLSGNVDREGTISSMISGGRWLRRGIVFEDE